MEEELKIEAQQEQSEENKLDHERKENAQRAAILLILFVVLTFLAVTMAILTSL